MSLFGRCAGSDIASATSGEPFVIADSHFTQ
jgi:hypothetical protein